MIGNKQLSLLCLFLLLASVAIAAPNKGNVRSLQKNFPTEYDTTLRMLKAKANASGNEEDDESEKEKIVNGAGTTGVDKDISESDEDDDIEPVSAPSSPSMKRKSKKNGTTDSNTLSPEEPKSTKKGSTKAPSAATPAPTSVDSVEVQADKYELFYTLAEPRLPSSEEFEELAEITRTYLEEYMQDEYGDDLDSFLTFMVFQEYQDGGPVQCDYRSIGSFDGNADSIPSSSELEDIIDQAFSDEEYLKRVNDLPSPNAFSTTESISQGSSPAQSTGQKFTIGTAAAGAAVLLLTAGAIFVSKRRISKRRKKVATDSADKLSADPSSDVSMAGTMSMDLDDATLGEMDKSDSEVATDSH